MSQKDKLFAITFLLWGLASINYILGTLGLIGYYGEITFLGPVGNIFGFFYGIGLMLLVYIFTAIGIVSVIHSIVKRQALSVFAKLFSVLIVLFFIASFYFN